MNRPTRASKPAASPRSLRRGMALLITLVLVVLLAVLSTGAIMSSTVEFREGRNSLVEQRAFAVAEYGLNAEIATWDRGRNLPPPAGMAIGAIDSMNVFVAQQDTAKVYIQRLTTTAFLVRSVGRASIGSAQLESQRETQMLVRLAYPTIVPGGAIVTAGALEVRGSAVVSGTNSQPVGWTQCPQLAGRDTFAISIAPGQSASIQKPEMVIGGVYRDPAAGDSNTYVRFGTESWNSLVANADLKLPGGTYGPRPAGSSAQCLTSEALNWGEPWRSGASYTAGCRDYFPLIYIDGPTTISNGRGQGILLVNGDLRLTGNFEWYGLIIVRDDIVKGNGTFDLWGSAMAANTSVNDNNTFNGNSTFRYSRCAIESALRASAILTRTRDRAWVQLQ